MSYTQRTLEPRLKNSSSADERSKFKSFLRSYEREIGKFQTLFLNTEFKWISCDCNEVFKRDSYLLNRKKEISTQRAESMSAYSLILY